MSFDHNAGSCVRGARRLLAVAVPLIAGTTAHTTPQGGPFGVDCPLSPTVTSDPGTFEHRWAGLVHSAFTLDGEEVWTGEDGGRIRHLEPTTGEWSFQPTPYQVRGTIRRLFFLPNGLDGWAISSDGFVLGTDDAGETWDALARIPALEASETYFGMEWEDLYDLWFDENGDDGWLVSLHGIFFTTNGGVCWEEASLLDQQGDPLDAGWIFTESMELYSIDVQVGVTRDVCAGTSDPSDFLALVSGQHGLILRSLDGEIFQIVLDAEDVCAMIDPMEDPCLDVPCSSSHQDWFELWSLEISNDPSDDLVLVVGGIGVNCGIILASTDAGCTWHREYHECAIDPNLDCATHADWDESDPPYRLDEFKTLYGVDIFDQDNTAVAAGYNGQHLRREFLDDENDTPVWRDRSRFAHISDIDWDSSNRPVIYPLIGAVAHDGQSGSNEMGTAWITGMGGHIRRTDDGGLNWSDDVLGEPFRINDLWFKPVSGFPDAGWQAGQFFRLAKSVDGGAIWAQGEPERLWGEGEAFQAVEFAGNGMNGVAVGGPMPGEDSNDPNQGPRILWTLDFGDEEWEEPTSLTYDSSTEEEFHLDTRLRDVCWAKDTANLEFYAVGEFGLVLHTADGGETWEQLQVPTSLVSDPHTLQFHGVAASSPNAIVVVGRRGGVARAFSYRYANQVWSWAELAVPTSSAGTIVLLTDVAARGVSIYAVGHRVASDDTRTGIVLKVGYPPSPDPPLFLEFDGPAYPDEVENCEALGIGVENQVLTSVEITTSNDVWIGGSCGRIWQYVPGEALWFDHKSQTNADVRGMSFTAPDRGYVAANGGAQTGQIVIRYQEQ